MLVTNIAVYILRKGLYDALCGRTVCVCVCVCVPCVLCCLMCVCIHVYVFVDTVCVCVCGSTVYMYSVCVKCVHGYMCVLYYFTDGTDGHYSREVGIQYKDFEHIVVRHSDVMVWGVVIWGVVW